MSLDFKRIYGIINTDDGRIYQLIDFSQVTHY